MKDNRIDHWGVHTNADELTDKAWPWMTRRYDRFDPTLPSNAEIEIYAKELQLDPEIDEPQKYTVVKDYKEWGLSEATHPQVKMQWKDSRGQVWVRIYGFESSEQLYEGQKRELMLYYNSSFVRRSDSKNMQAWAEKKDFSGRWMEQRTDCIDFLWNEMPWSDSYKRLKRDEWVSGDQWNPYPCEVMVAYDEQLQEENYGFLNQEETYSITASMPCGEMMRVMKLYTAERGIVRRIEDDEIVAMNMSLINKRTGLVVRKDILCEYMRKQKYHLFCFLLGNKEVRIGGMTIIDWNNLSGCTMMNEKGEWTIVQKLRAIEKESMND